MSSASEMTLDEPRSTVFESSVMPASADELTQFVRQAIAKKTAIFPSGGRTALGYGGNRARAGTELSTLNLNKVIDYPADDMTITVEAGMTLENLQKVLADHNQYLPIDPPHAEKATLGGIIATGWTGPRRYQSMRPRDQLIGICFVSGQGNVVRGGGKVVKNVAGYDFPKLLTGSVGSLGVITELTFKVRPRPESSAAAIVQIKDTHELENYLTKLNTSATRPTAIELLNQKAAAEALAETGVKPARYSVVLFFDESAKAVAWQLDQLKIESPENSDVLVLKDILATNLQTGLTQRLAADNHDVATRAVVAPSMIPRFLEHIGNDRWNVQAHAGQGIATCSLEPGISLADVTREVNRLREIVRNLGGAVTLPVCRHDWKECLSVWGEKRPDWDIMAGIKRALDPHSLMNPGVLLGLH